MRLLNWIRGHVEAIQEEAETERLMQQNFARPHSVWDKETQGFVEDCDSWNSAADRCNDLNKGLPAGHIRYVPREKH